MHTLTDCRRVSLCTALFIVLLGTLPAQSALYVEHGGKPCLVVSAVENRPCIEVDGKIVETGGQRYALQHIDEYAPLFVDVQDIKLKSAYEIGGYSDHKAAFHFEANFLAGYALDNVFILLELNSLGAGRSFFIYEIGRLIPNEPSRVQFTVPLKSPLKNGPVPYHIFVRGTEVLHSGMAPDACKLVFDRVVAGQVSKLKDGAPRPLIGPVPVYPAALRKAKRNGEAVVRIWIQPNGSVRDPVIQSATDAAFGEAALIAVKRWRFIPCVKDGIAIESAFEMPFTFVPPD